MKNVIISILATIIFYQNFVVVKMPFVLPFIVITFWIAIAYSEAVYKEYIRRKIKYNRIFKKIRSAL